MPDAQKERLHRKYVIWCVVNGRPWSAISDAGLELIIAEWDPAFAAATPHPDTLKKKEGHEAKAPLRTGQFHQSFTALIRLGIINVLE